jgi:hypothetical protein
MDLAMAITSGVVVVVCGLLVERNRKNGKAAPYLPKSAFALMIVIGLVDVYLLIAHH